MQEKHIALSSLVQRAIDQAIFNMTLEGLMQKEKEKLETGE